MFFLIGFFGVILFFIFMKIAEHIQNKKDQELFQKKLKAFKILENSRGNYKTDIITTIKEDDLPRAGFPADFFGVTSIVLGNDGTVHFSYPNSPDMWLLKIDYRPQYEQTTTGTTSGRTGSAVVGGLLAGNAGATIGGARKRKINATTSQQEVDSIGLLTFGVFQTQEYLSIEVMMNQEYYYRLQKEFLHVDQPQFY